MPAKATTRIKAVGTCIHIGSSGVLFILAFAWAICNTSLGRSRGVCTTYYLRMKSRMSADQRPPLNRWGNVLDFGYNRGYTSTMKTAVSIPDSVFQAAERAASRLSMSRSELYAKAVEEFVAARCRDDVTERLNQVYSDNPSSLDPTLSEMQSLSLESGRW